MIHRLGNTIVPFINLTQAFFQAVQALVEFRAPGLLRNTLFLRVTLLSSVRNALLNFNYTTCLVPPSNLLLKKKKNHRLIELNPHK
jgi:hypothetical protein